MSSTLQSLRKRPKALLLDWDGVIGCENLFLNMIVRLAAHHQVNLRFDEVKHDHALGQIGCLWEYTLRKLLAADVPVSREQLEEVESQIYFGRNGYSGLCREERLIVEPPQLQRLSADVEGNLGVVTNRPRDRFDMAVRRTRLTQAGLFAVTVTRSDVSPGREKPSPDGILLACEKLRVSPAETMFVGDSESDIIAADEAGTIPVGLAAPDSLLAQTLAKAWAVAVIPSLHTLSKLWS